jgi:hypothetical protein
MKGAKQHIKNLKGVCHCCQEPIQVTIADDGSLSSLKRVDREVRSAVWNTTLTVRTNQNDTIRE